jgi:hypothetical protein
MIVGSHLDGSDPSMRLSSFVEKPLHLSKLICKSNPHLDNFMETPLNFIVIAFAQATSRALLWNHLGL